MKNALLPLAAAGLILSATAAIAAVEDFMSADTDRSGTVAWAEFSLIYPEVTEQEFLTADTDGDGELSQDEFDALILTTGAIGVGQPPMAVEVQPMPQSLTFDPDLSAD